MRRPKRRGWMPVMLIGVGVYLMAGCIYVPTFQLPKDGKDFRKLVGDANSRKPIRPGFASRAAVLAALGEPKQSTRDGRTIAYAFRATDGYWVWPICFYAGPAHTDYRVRLTFNDRDDLVHYEVDTMSNGGSMGIMSFPQQFPPLEPGGRPWPPNVFTPATQPAKGK